MSKPILTIAIPTYNRPEKLLQTINQLLSQIESRVSILVIDNFSNVVIKDYVGMNIPPRYLECIRIERNPMNIGADANFMRCFEYCQTEYMWTLSDDDIVLPSSIRNILTEIDKYSSQDIIGFNFGSNYTDRKDSIIVNNIDDLLTKMENFENFLLLSTAVYNVFAYNKFIRYGFWGAYSMASQNIPCLIAISRGKKLVLSKYAIIDNIVGDRTEKWPDSQQALGLSSVLETPLGLKGKQYKKLGRFLFRNIVTFPRVFCDIILAINFEVKKIDEYHVYIYKKIYLTTFEFRRSKLKQYFLYRIFLILLTIKPLSKIVLKSSKFRSYVLTSSTFPLFKR